MQPTSYPTGRRRLQLYAIPISVYIGKPASIQAASASASLLKTNEQLQWTIKRSHSQKAHMHRVTLRLLAWLLPLMPKRAGHLADHAPAARPLAGVSGLPAVSRFPFDTEPPSRRPPRSPASWPESLPLVRPPARVSPHVASLLRQLACAAHLAMAVHSSLLKSHAHVVAFACCEFDGSLAAPAQQPSLGPSTRIGHLHHQ
jgi:hypothetical protein